MTYIEAAAWTEANPKIPESMYNIMTNNEKVIEKILKISRTDFENTVKNFQNPEQLKAMVDALVQRGFIDIPANAENLQAYRDNIGRAFDMGTQNYKPTTKPLMDTYRQIIQNNEVDYIKNITDKQKTDIGQILTDAIQNQTQHPQIVKEIADKAGLTESRAGNITRTSLMRASNGASYAQNSIEGAKYFVVDFRSTACKYCIKAFHGRVFKITDAKFIPPIHTNCACVPMFFNTLEEAEAFAKDIKKRNALELKELEKKGYKHIPVDGSGPNINLKPEDMPKSTSVKTKTKDKITFN